MTAKTAAKAGFTPGPWNVTPHLYRVYAGNVENGVTVICDTANNATTRTPENAANARLIAASPELYRLLKEVIRAGDFIDNSLMRELVQLLEAIHG